MSQQRCFSSCQHACAVSCRSRSTCNDTIAQPSALFDAAAVHVQERMWRIHYPQMEKRMMQGRGRALSRRLTELEEKLRQELANSLPVLSTMYALASRVALLHHLYKLYGACTHNILILNTVISGLSACCGSSAAHCLCMPLYLIGCRLMTLQERAQPFGKPQQSAALHILAVCMQCCTGLGRQRGGKHQAEIAARQASCHSSSLRAAAGASGISGQAWPCKW